MFSVQTNAAATQALQNLSASRLSLEQSQDQLSTGRKLNGPKDSASDYIIANRLKIAMVESRVLKDNQLRAQSLLEVTQAATATIADMLSGLKEKATQLADTSLSSASAAALRDEINSLSAEVGQVARAASFDGINLIGQTPPAESRWGRPYAGFINFGTDYATYDSGGRSGRMDIYFDVRNATNQSIQIDWGDGQTYSTNTSSGTPETYSRVISHQYETPGDYQMHYNISVNGGAGAGFHIGGINFVPDADTTTIPVSEGGGTMSLAHKSLLSGTLGLANLQSQTPEQIVAAVDNALSIATDTASYYGFRQNEVERLITHTTRLADSYDKGYGDLVDADMSKLSALWQAQQTQTQLANQALSIANQTPKLLLSLFG